MNVRKQSTLKNLVAAGLAVALMTTAISSNAHAANYNKGQIYRDGHFGKISSQLRQDLRRDNYYVMNIEAEGNKRIAVYAKKDNEPYLLKYTYPELELISSDKKQWSTIWKNKNNYSQKSQRNNYDDDIEERIKKENRYPTIKQRAIKKVKNMGYQVTDIELEEENNRGVFEIDAKRGSQDYEIVLSYPNLAVIKLERD